MARISWALAAAILFLTALPVGAQSEQKKIEKLQKELDKITAAVAKVQSGLDKAKPGLEAEYKKLRDKESWTTIAKALATGGVPLKKAAGDDQERLTSSIKKDLLPGLLKSQGFTELSKMLIPSLSELSADQMMGEETPDLTDVVKSVISDALPSGDFEKDYLDVIRQAMEPKIRGLLETQASLQGEIDELNEAIQARESGTPPSMVKVPGGKFTMGLDRKDIEQFVKDLGLKQEQLMPAYASYPSRKAEVNEFFIDLKEVTCKWWAAYMRDNPGVPSPSYLTPNGPTEIWKDGKIPAGFEERPVTAISAEEAIQFCQWMGRRLPNEVEWEAAARHREGGKIRHWPWGPKFDEKNCNFNGFFGKEKNVADGLPPMVPTNTFPKGRSVLGLSDLAGNAAEWTTSRFTAYPGFKDVSISGRTFRSSDFVEERFVVRGGHAQNRDVGVTSWFRIGAPPNERFPWVGFRTAASVEKGRDLLESIDDSGFFKRNLVDYKTLISDELADRSFPALALKDSRYYSAVMAGGWDPAASEPTRAKFVAIASRDANDFRDFATMKRFVKDDEMLLLGFLNLDVPSVEPKLEPGKYFVLWQNSHLPTEEELALAAMTEVKAGDPEPAKDDPKRPDKKPAKDTKKQEKEKPKPVADAILFRKLGGRREAPIRLETFNPPVVVDEQSTRVVARDDKDEVELVFAYPIKNQKKSFLFTATLKLEPGTAATLK